MLDSLSTVLVGLKLSTRRTSERDFSKIAKQCHQHQRTKTLRVLSFRSSSLIYVTVS
jgi:hypothetical protein